LKIFENVQKNINQLNMQTLVAAKIFCFITLTFFQKSKTSSLIYIFEDLIFFLKYFSNLVNILFQNSSKRSHEELTIVDHT